MGRKDPSPAWRAMASSKLVEAYVAQSESRPAKNAAIIHPAPKRLTSQNTP